MFKTVAKIYCFLNKVKVILTKSLPSSIEF